MMEELGYTPEPILICGNNQGSIFMADNPEMDGRSKHIDLKWPSIHNYVKEGPIEIFYIEGTQNPTDMFTKNLGFEALSNCQK